MHALLILDMQAGLFHGPDPIGRSEALLDTINSLLDKAHAAGAAVFLARHVGPPGSPIEPGSPLTRLIEALHLNGSETVFEKSRPNAFVGTGLVERLKEAGAHGVVIAGLKTQYCVDSTCRAARDLGLDAVLIEDGHGCSDTAFGSHGQIVAHHNATLAGAFCRVVHSRDWQFA
ncbi:isochorismatase family protein [Pseudomonas syringae]|nr:isochorismatase family protein [Pseudomonas syringae]MBD8793321.1 isochorismatase family protein [Pseudomonas syringae]MBD8804091.1 isochorismatase family protein [Pseudomonas syringae]MBD8814855.1 isochorismatase family protein [Pseudomonas syringae]